MGGPLAGFARPKSAFARGIERGIRRSARRIVDALEQAADRSSPFSRLRPSSLSLSRAGVLGRLDRRRGRCPSPGARSGGRRGSRSGAWAAARRSARRRQARRRARSAALRSSVSRRPVRGRLHKPRWRAGALVAPGILGVGVRCRSFVCLRLVLLRCSLAAPSAFSFFLGAADEGLAGEIDQRLARKEHGDRGDDAGRRQRPRRTASTASSARSAPFSLAPCQAPLARILGLSRS